MKTINVPRRFESPPSGFLDDVQSEAGIITTTGYPVAADCCSRHRADRAAIPRFEIRPPLRVVRASRFEHGATFLREHDSNIAMTIDALGSDETLLMQVTQVP
jgi:hypothetical protein